jgi:hypothetical protein
MSGHEYGLWEAAYGPQPEAEPQGIEARKAALRRADGVG